MGGRRCGGVFGGVLWGVPVVGATGGSGGGQVTQQVIGSRQQLLTHPDSTAKTLAINAGVGGGGRGRCRGGGRWGGGERIEGSCAAYHWQFQ